MSLFLTLNLSAISSCFSFCLPFVTVQCPRSSHFFVFFRFPLTVFLSPSPFCHLALTFYCHYFPPPSSVQLVGVEADRIKAEETNQAIRKEIADFRVPEVLDYVKETASLQVSRSIRVASSRQVQKLA